jgi:hypothetical protein
MQYMHLSQHSDVLSCCRLPVTLQRVERVRTLLAKLGSCQHNNFSVKSTPDEGYIVKICAAWGMRDALRWQGRRVAAQCHVLALTSATG